MKFLHRMTQKQKDIKARLRDQETRELRDEWRNWYLFISEKLGIDQGGSPDLMGAQAPTKHHIPNRNYMRDVLIQRRADFRLPDTDEGSATLYRIVWNELQGFKSVLDDQGRIIEAATKPFNPDNVNEAGEPNEARVWFGGTLGTVDLERMRAQLAKTPQAPSQRKRWVFIGGGVLTLVLVACMVRVLGSAAATPVLEPVAYMNATPVALPEVVGVTVGTQTDTITDRRYPFGVCIDRESPPELGSTMTITTTRYATQYTIVETAPYDVVLLDCANGAAPTRYKARYATHTRYETADPAVVESVTVRDASHDPSISADLLAVDVVLTDASWHDAVLVTDNGARWTPTRVDETTMRYLIPRTPVSSQVALELRGDGLPRLRSFTLPLLDSRNSYLAEHLTITDVALTRASNQSLTLSITVAASKPMTMEARDIATVGPGSQVPVRGDTCTIDSSTATVCSFVVDLPAGQQVTLTVAGLQYRLSS